MSKSNIRHLRVSPELFAAICKEDPNQFPSYYSVTKNPIPNDAVVVGVAVEYHADGLVLDLEIESKEFTDNVPDPLPQVEHTQIVVVVSADHFIAGAKEEE